MAEFVRAQIGTCWWCGRDADSREHKFKRTDIERGFGRGPYRDDRTLVKQGYSDRPSEMTGSKSKVFKFEPMICARCNCVRSQPFDAAYDQFMDCLFDNEAGCSRRTSRRALPDPQSEAEVVESSKLRFGALAGDHFIKGGHRVREARLHTKPPRGRVRRRAELLGVGTVPEAFAEVTDLLPDLGIGLARLAAVQVLAGLKLSADSQAGSMASRMSGHCSRFASVGLDRVALRADLTILATLACALARARTAPLAA
jgi:hypothetical protein